MPERIVFADSDGSGRLRDACADGRSGTAAYEGVVGVVIGKGIDWVRGCIGRRWPVSKHVAGQMG